MDGKIRRKITVMFDDYYDSNNSPREFRIGCLTYDTDWPNTEKPDIRQSTQYTIPRNILGCVLNKEPEHGIQLLEIAIDEFGVRRVCDAIIFNCECMERWDVNSFLAENLEASIRDGSFSWKHAHGITGSLAQEFTGYINDNIEYSIRSWFSYQCSAEYTLSDPAYEKWKNILAGQIRKCTTKNDLLDAFRNGGFLDAMAERFSADMRGEFMDKKSEEESRRIAQMRKTPQYCGA